MHHSILNEPSVRYQSLTRSNYSIKNAPMALKIVKVPVNSEVVRNLGVEGVLDEHLRQEMMVVTDLTTRNVVLSEPVCV